ncbi:MAG: hypothetical protein PHO27_11510 [Sulfuricurvum sp.]|nr:hypothetical protein [Sulfuricurvum sp.]
MKTNYFLLFLPLFFSACFNERGISAHYYRDCEEYYDLQGYYHKKCDKNLLDYKEIKEAIQPIQNPEKGSVK